MVRSDLGADLSCYLFARYSVLVGAGQHLKVSEGGLPCPCSRHMRSRRGWLASDGGADGLVDILAKSGLQYLTKSSHPLLWGWTRWRSLPSSPQEWRRAGKSSSCCARARRCQGTGRWLSLSCLSHRCNLVVVNIKSGSLLSGLYHDMKFQNTWRAQLIQTQQEKLERGGLCLVRWSRSRTFNNS